MVRRVTCPREAGCTKFMFTFGSHSGELNPVQIGEFGAQSRTVALRRVQQRLPPDAREEIEELRQSLGLLTYLQL